MAHPGEYELGDVAGLLRDACEADARVIAEVIGATCRRFPSLGQSEKTARVAQLIAAGAWTDAALALIDLELPLWHIRRLAMTRANGIARCRASASFPIGSINASRRGMQTWRSRSSVLSSKPSVSARRKAGPAFPRSAETLATCMKPFAATISVKLAQKPPHSAAVRISTGSARTAQNLNSG